MNSFFTWGYKSGIYDHPWVQENVVGKIGWSFNTASHVEKSHSVIAEIFLWDLISYFSYVWPKVRNFVAYENHTGMPVYVTPPLQYGVRKSANTRVRNIDAYENFCDYNMSSQVSIYGIWLFLQKKKKVDFVDSQKEGSFEELIGLCVYHYRNWN